MAHIRQTVSPKLNDLTRKNFLCLTINLETTETLDEHRLVIHEGRRKLEGFWQDQDSIYVSLGHQSADLQVINTLAFYGFMSTCAAD